jgi:glycosyltransferase involved in cell wall biosynthesis
LAVTAESPPARPTGGAHRVAWFSPMPPSSSGIAAYSAEIVPRLRARGLAIDVYVERLDGPDAADGRAVAADFVWRHRRAAYDLVVYELGNAACHDYMWGYLFHYPGLVVLHDAQVHQARAQSLLGGWRPRRDDYRQEFAANHPDAPADLALLIAEGLGGSLFGHWPLVRLVLEAARLAAVHSPALAARLAEHYGVPVQAIPMGVADPLVATGGLSAGEVRARHGLQPDDVVIGAFGGLTPEKRLPQVIEAVAGLAADRPNLHLLLVGSPARHYDVIADAERLGIAGRVHHAGFVSDADLPAYMQAADIGACLRWPTNGETSASWLRVLAAGRATVITDLAHQPEVPVVDARAWPAAARPVAVAVPILDEADALRAAFQVLVESSSRRARLGTAARAWWQAHHTLARMEDAYVAAIAAAVNRPAPRPALPAHLDDAGDRRLAALLAPYGVAPPASVAR